MKKLIETLQILLKYGDPAYPTVCEHDVMYIVGIEPELISAEDKNKLLDLGFHVAIEGETEDGSDEPNEESKIYSYKYGSS